MAPPNVQQLLQGVCEQLKDNFGSPGGPFDPQFHISHFLWNINQRLHPPSERQPCFRVRFPFPFSGLSFIGERTSSSTNTHVSDSAPQSHPFVASSKNILESLNIRTHNPNDGGKDVREPSNVPDGPSLQSPRSLNVVLEKEDLSSEIDHAGTWSDKPNNENHNINSVELPISQKQLKNMDFASAPPSKETLGRATWTFLHTLAAQFPEKPTRQQQRDVKELMAILSRLYPCKECADHFKEVLKANPVQADSGVELAQWMCRVHNIVNRSLGKPMFPCERVDARWGALNCDEGACDLQGRTH